MNIFKGLEAYAQNKKGELMFDANGNAYLYHKVNNAFTEITLYPPKHFLPDYLYNPTGKILKKLRESNKGFIDQIEELYPNKTFNQIKVYSIKKSEDIVDGVKKTILKYGFINERGYAITHAIYDRVCNFVDGKAEVFLDGYANIIDTNGHPIVDGQPLTEVEFVYRNYYGRTLRGDNQNFLLCNSDGKYGVVNLFRYLCIPCIYDHISFKPSNADYVSYIELQKNGLNYTAFIEGNSICNIVELQAKSLVFVERFIIIEEEFSDHGKTVSKFGLLSSGGTRLLESKYDKLEVYHPYFIITTIAGLKQLILPNAKILLDKCDNISYGRFYDDEKGKELYYFSVNEKYINIYYEQSQDVGPLLAGENDKEYFTLGDDSLNKYFAVVEGDRTKLVDINGEEIMPPIIPSEYRVITNTYGEGIVGVSKKVQKKYSDGTPYSVTCYGYINAEGKLLGDLIFNGIEKFKNGVAKAYYDSANSRTYCELDKHGKVIYQHTDLGDSEPMDNTWADLIGDAFEGDSDAYWNID